LYEIDNIFFLNYQRRWRMDKKSEIFLAFAIAITCLFSIETLFEVAYRTYKKEPTSIGFPIIFFTCGLIICVVLITSIVISVYIHVQDYYHQHERYLLRKPIKHNKSSRYGKIEWLSKRHIRKLKMIMSGVFIQENH